MTKFALLCYSTHNLGDEIQSVAARQFIPHPDLLIDRDTWNTNSSPAGGYKIILNGWFTHNPECWPPPSFLRPCLISMHISRERFRPTALVSPASALLEGRSLQFLKEYEPVGGRDLWTTSLLSRHGIQSYFSGCLTLTLGFGATWHRSEYICAVDLPEEIAQRIESRAKSPVVRLSHRETSVSGFENRCEKATRLLNLYAHASCVVTTRLHCALPSIAFGTPTLLINTIADQYRLSGLIEFTHNCTPEKFVRGFRYDVNEPPPNPGKHAQLRHAMVQRVQSFTGHQIRAFQPSPERLSDD